MTRRGFLRRIGVGVVALTLARHLPGIAPVPVIAPPPPWLTNEGLCALEDNFMIARLMQRDYNVALNMSSELIMRPTAPSYVARIENIK